MVSRSRWSTRRRPTGGWTRAPRWISCAASGPTIPTCPGGRYGCLSCSRSGTRSTWSGPTTRWHSAGRPYAAQPPDDEPRWRAPDDEPPTMSQGTSPVTSPRISVVVAFFNNADDLADCLDSIAAQSYPDLEVIMVDDGSTDHSAAIARAKAAADPRFILIQPPEHGGPGGARNRGIEHARGEYLAFVDGDDVLPANAYELLLHTLERSGSDFVSGAVSRIGAKGIAPSALHQL